MCFALENRFNMDTLCLFMYTCIYIGVYVCMGVCVCVCVCMYVRMYVRVCMRMYAYICMYVCICEGHCLHTRFWHRPGEQTADVCVSIRMCFDKCDMWISPHPLGAASGGRN